MSAGSKATITRYTPTRPTEGSSPEKSLMLEYVDGKVGNAVNASAGCASNRTIPATASGYCAAKALTIRSAGRMPDQHDRPRDASRLEKLVEIRRHRGAVLGGTRVVAPAAPGAVIAARASGRADRRGDTAPIGRTLAQA